VYTVGLFLCMNRASLLFNIYYLFQQMHIYILKHYITNARTYFGTSAPFSESFDIAFAEVMKY
jgi:hypothetical protein